MIDYIILFVNKLALSLKLIEVQILLRELLLWKRLEVRYTLQT